jgi:hypothetical protein
VKRRQNSKSSKRSQGVTTKVTAILGDRKKSEGVKPKLHVVSIKELVLDEKNANKGTKRGRELLGNSCPESLFPGTSKLQ